MLVCATLLGHRIGAYLWSILVSSEVPVLQRPPALEPAGVRADGLTSDEKAGLPRCDRKTSEIAIPRCWLRCCERVGRHP